MKRKSPFETVLKAKHDNAHAFPNVKKGPLSTMITLTKQSPIKMDKKERESLGCSLSYGHFTDMHDSIVASRPSNQGVATKIVIIYDRLPFDGTDRQDLWVR